jgi:hypothetical protein
MNIGGYEIPMISTLMPWALLILFSGVIKILAGRLWQDKELSLKKIVLLGLSIGLIFVIVLNLGDVIGWVWSMVSKIMDIIRNVKIQ